MHANTVVPKIIQGFTCWLKGEGERLPQAIERTATEGLFPRHDIMHMVGHSARSVTASSLNAWIDRVDEHRSHTTPGAFAGFAGSTGRADAGSGSGEALQPNDSEGTKNRVDAGSGGASARQHVLCLHAGNLPMVGLQDLVATLLSGSVYHGKLSSKDPWLMDSLLRCLREYLPEQIGSWSVDLDELRGIKYDKVLFAGSEATVPEVMQYIRSNHMLRESNENFDAGFPQEPAQVPTQDTTANRFLARTARFSIAFFQQKTSQHSPEVMNQLAEAIMRYEGRGCRSVAVVVAPFGPDEAVKALRQYAATYPSSHTPEALVHYHQAYLRSIGRYAELAGPMLVCDYADLVGEKDVVVWLQDTAALTELVRRYHGEVQSVYTEVAEPIHHALQAPEPLSQAQTPPIDWKPDGVDVLKWLHIPA